MNETGPSNNSSVESTDSWVAREKGLLQHLVGPWTRRLALALMALSTEACSLVVHTASESRTQIGGSVLRQGEHTTRMGSVKELCHMLTDELKKPGTEEVSGVHRYANGEFVIRGTKLPNGEFATFEVVTPSGHVVSCRH